MTRKELAVFYGVSDTTFARWLSELTDKMDIKTRKILRPNEISVVIEVWGDFRQEMQSNCRLDR